jgi:cell division protein FtsZ
MSEMGKAMMGTGEALGDNRAIEAAEKAIANPLLDGVSMKGAKGVIISITGGEDMRLMEVDEAANHIKELVDPDANIIWGSAFNNELDGKIRVSVVATGIDVDEATQATPLPAKVFAFPSTRQTTETTSPAATTAAEPAIATPTATQPEPEHEPLVLTPPETLEETVAEAAPEMALTDELTLDQPAETVSVEEELLLGEELAAEEAATEIPETAGEAAPSGARSWLTREEPQAETPARTQGGTLFERMSNIARGAAKAQVDEEDAQDGPRLRTGREPLDIPRFLNRQNNQ